MSTPFPKTKDDREYCPLCGAIDTEFATGAPWAWDDSVDDSERHVYESAPEMLAALKLAGAALDLWLNGPWYGDQETFDTTDRALTAVNAAIKKAEGGE